MLVMFKSVLRISVPLLLVLSLFFCDVLKSQGLSSFQYISPRPGSKFVMPGTTIALRLGAPYTDRSLTSADIFVTGSESGRMPGQRSLSVDRRTLFFVPDRAFIPGEEVEVRVAGVLETGISRFEGDEVFSFTITPAVIDIGRRPEILERIYCAEHWQQGPVPFNGPSRHTQSDPTLPEDFPIIEIQVSNDPPVNGYYFMAPSWGGWVFPDAPAYLVIFDNTGTPVFYQKNEHQNNDLRLQPNGMVTYHENHPYHRHAVMNSNMEEIGEYTVQNGYTFTDHHEFLMLPNGHAFVMTYDAQLVDMDTVVPGGQPGATVIGFVFQELDEAKNVVFQWRSWDHFEITDASEHEDLTAEIIDYVHGNSIEIVSDTTLVISSRNMNEVTKIDWRTGEIIWRLGGEKNQFTFIGDTLGFDYQHDARILSDGLLSIFDNGQHHPDPKFSSAVEYEIDEENMTATLVRRWRSDPDIWAVIMGNSQEVTEGGRVIGWGSGVPGITEFHPDGSTALEVYFDNFNYRAYRFDWETDAFGLSADTLDFGEVYCEGAGEEAIMITNNLETELVINHVYSRTTYFSASDGELPLVIEPGDSATLILEVRPDSIGLFEDVLTLCNNIENDSVTRRVAKQLGVRANATKEAGLIQPGGAMVDIYPNPTSSGKITVDAVPGRIVSIRVADLDGRLLEQFKTKKRKARVDLSGYSPGIYLVIVETESSPAEYHRVVVTGH